jgi:hypothetical protein
MEELREWKLPVGFCNITETTGKIKDTGICD